MANKENIVNALEILRNHCVVHRFKCKGCVGCPCYISTETEYGYECIIDVKPYKYALEYIKEDNN